MLKLVWVPKKFKKFSFTGFHNEMEETMKQIKKLHKQTNQRHADMLIMQNKAANFTEEEAAHNIRVLVKWLEKEFNM